MAGVDEERTIAAISSPPGAGRRGVVRVSGPRAEELARAVLATVPPAEFPAGRLAFRAEVDDGVGRQPALVLWMPGPRSFTREDVLELHLPGHPALLARALERLLDLGAALARPGEFTRRAFERGRLDLSRAEGVLELVLASNEAERRAALALTGGGLADRLAAVRAPLDDLRALCEAGLDFDQEDTGSVPEAELVAALDRADAALEAALGWELARAAPSGDPEIHLVGAPNAGKSSLFNRLGSRARALVSEWRGTTRDVLEARWTLAGVSCRLWDSPGVEEAETAPDRRAQELARTRRASADLVLWVVDATRQDAQQLSAEAARLTTGAPVIAVWNQLDRPGAARTPPIEVRAATDDWVRTSARTGEGLEVLAERAAHRLGLGAEGGEASAEGAVRAELSLRHRRALERAREVLAAVRDDLGAGAPLDGLAERLREATAALDEVSGATTAEDVLDRIFARFCLGK